MKKNILLSLGVAVALFTTQSSYAIGNKAAAAKKVGAFTCYVDIQSENIGDPFLFAQDGSCFMKQRTVSATGNTTGEYFFNGPRITDFSGYISADPSKNYIHLIAAAKSKSCLSVCVSKITALKPSNNNSNVASSSKAKGLSATSSLGSKSKKSTDDESKSKAAKDSDDSAISKTSDKKQEVEKEPITAEPNKSDSSVTKTGSTPVKDAPATKPEEEKYTGIQSDYVSDYKKNLNGEQSDRVADISARQSAMNNKGAIVTPSRQSSIEDDAHALPATVQKESAQPTSQAYGDRNVDGTYSKEEKKLDKAELKVEQKAAQKTAAENDILKKNSGNYGGKYGGAKVETTETINTGVKTLSNIASQVATNSSTRQNSTVMNGIQQQGSAATQSAINNSQADMLENSAKANSTLGLATTVMSATQAMRIAQHLNSKSKVSETYSAAITRADAALNQAKTNYQQNVSKCEQMLNSSYKEKCLTEEKTKWSAARDLHDSQLDYADNNKSAEITAQGNAAGKQTIEAATTAAQAAMMLKQAASLKAAAAMIRNQQVTDTGNGFAFNPGGVTANPTPDTSAITNPGAVTTDDSVLADGGVGAEQINPNVADGDPNAPKAGDFKNEMAKGGGGAPLGLGGAGGTSAAKDDGAKPEASALTKSGTGTYSGGEGSGSKFSRAGGSGGSVGIDPSFTDMMKNLLKGDDKKDAAPELAIEDRSPASDQAAVLGRNQNIFDAIHKRYQKKHTEGAIVFTGDQG